jgi:hypothetical protein
MSQLKTLILTAIAFTILFCQKNNSKTMAEETSTIEVTSAMQMNLEIEIASYITFSHSLDIYRKISKNTQEAMERLESIRQPINISIHLLKEGVHSTASSVGLKDQYFLTDANLFKYIKPLQWQNLEKMNVKINLYGHLNLFTDGLWDLTFWRFTPFYYLTSNFTSTTSNNIKSILFTPHLDLGLHLCYLPTHYPHLMVDGNIYLAYNPITYYHYRTLFLYSRAEAERSENHLLATDNLGTWNTNIKISHLVNKNFIYGIGLDHLLVINRNSEVSIFLLLPEINFQLYLGSRWQLGVANGVDILLKKIPFFIINPSIAHQEYNQVRTSLYIKHINGMEVNFSWRKKTNEQIYELGIRF